MDKSRKVNTKAKKSRKRKRSSSTALSRIHPQVAGIDLGSREHWVCAPEVTAGTPNVRTFGTTMPQLQQLVEWLLEQGVESVAMESTNVYWIPLYELLESCGIEVLLVNARQLRYVPGRKTDMRDCQWIQLLHSCGLLRGSFRPHEIIVAIRGLHRQMSNLVRESTRFVQWMQKALDQMNIQIHRAVTDLTGQTGMAIVRAIVDGERDPRRLAALRHGRCKKSSEEFAEHLAGNWREEHLFNLESALKLYDMTQREIAAYEARILEEIRALQPVERRDQSAPKHPNAIKEKAIRRRGGQNVRTELWRFAGVDLTRIDGIGTEAALTLLTEAGFDLTAFPSEKHFVSWLRLAPKTAVSAGKPLHYKKPNGTGSTRVAGVLRMAAVSLKHSKTALGAAFRRKARHKGWSVAVFCMARRLAVLVYRMLRYGQDYVDIGQDLYEDRFRQRRLAGLKDAAKSLGFQLLPQVPTG